MSNNPFQSFGKNNRIHQLDGTVNDQKFSIDLIEEILLVTFSRNQSCIANTSASKPKYLYYIDESMDDDFLSFSNINNLIFERIFTSLSKENVIKFQNGFAVNIDTVMDNNPLNYLYGCFARTMTLINRKKSSILTSLNLLKEAILNQSSLYVINNYEIDPAKTALNMYQYLRQNSNASDCIDYTMELFKRTDMKLTEDGIIDNHLLYFSSFFQHFLDKTFLNNPPLPMLVIWRDSLQTLYCPERSEFVSVMELLVDVPAAAEMIVDYSLLGLSVTASKGTDCERSLLGRFLCSSHLPRGAMEAPEMFSKMPMTVQEKNSEEQNIWQLTKNLQNESNHLFMSLFQCGKHRPSIKSKLLQWFGLCLHLNRDRSKLAHSTGSSGATESTTLASDGFMMNLTSVLFHVAGPLLKAPINDGRVFSLQVGFVEARELHATLLPGLFEETRLIPMTEALRPQTPLSPHYSVLTQLFFLVHKSVHLGFHVLHGKFMELNQQLHRMQEVYEELISGQQGTVEGDRLKQMMSGQMALYMSLNAAMRQPEFLEGLLTLVVVTCRLLVHIASAEQQDNNTAPLACVPEFLMDNMLAFLSYLRHFEDGYLESGDLRGLESILEMVVMFMGGAGRVRNPHLRARVATVLEGLVPQRDDTPTAGKPPTTFYLRQQLFAAAAEPSWAHDTVIEALVSAFTTMELSTGGENLRFEEKFEYRRPIYACFRFFHGTPRFDAQIKRLERVALEKVNEVEAPLFLKFLNLLINDATYLLDEALSYLGQLKTKETERLAQGGRYSNQTDEGNFQHMVMLCRYHNTLGTDTIEQLGRLATLCPDIMIHPILADRLACTLNYFLAQLVGPRRAAFSVRDKEAYAFRPKQLVSLIARIYVALGGKEEFCRAIVNDGRSYSDQLLEASSELLARMSLDMGLDQEFGALKDRLKVFSANQNEEDGNFEDAPEEYLDPIMGTLMRDPVTLPSSGVTVERKTIFRHLLSDATDPFNRQPLAMSDVAANEALRLEINDWIRRQKKAVE